MANFPNHQHALRPQGYDYTVVYRPGKANIADSLSRINQCEPKDSIGEEFEFVRVVAEESLPVALKAKQVQLASDSYPELASLRHTYIHIYIHKYIY